MSIKHKIKNLGDVDTKTEILKKLVDELKGKKEKV